MEEHDVFFGEDGAVWGESVADCGDYGFGDEGGSGGCGCGCGGGVAFVRACVAGEESAELAFRREFSEARVVAGCSFEGLGEDEEGEDEAEDLEVGCIS